MLLCILQNIFTSWDSYPILGLRVQPIRQASRLRVLCAPKKPQMGAVLQEFTATGPTKARKGFDAGDHPQ